MLIARYQGRICGPLLDRIDLQVEVPACAPRRWSARRTASRARGRSARGARRAHWRAARQGCANAELAGAALDAPLPRSMPRRRSSCTAPAARLGWSARSFHRVLRIARTIADLAGARRDRRRAHLAEAIQYRRVLSVA